MLKTLNNIIDYDYMQLFIFIIVSILSNLTDAILILIAFQLCDINESIRKSKVTFNANNCVIKAESQDDQCNQEI